MGPPRRPPLGLSGWNDRAAVALLVLVAGHLLAVEPASAASPLTPDRLARVVAAHDLPALVTACEGSPREQVRHGAHQLRRRPRRPRPLPVSPLSALVSASVAPPHPGTTLGPSDLARRGHRAAEGRTGGRRRGDRRGDGDAATAGARPSDQEGRAVSPRTLYPLCHLALLLPFRSVGRRPLGHAWVRRAPVVGGARRRRAPVPPVLSALIGGRTALIGGRAALIGGRAALIASGHAHLLA